MKIFKAYFDLSQSTILFINFGILHAIKYEVMTLSEVEEFWFRPGFMTFLEDNNYPKYLIDMIHNGTELSDVRDICGKEVFDDTLNSLIEENKKLIKTYKDG